MEVTFDTIGQGTGVDLDRERLEITRTGVATGIDAAAAADPYVLVRALEGVLAGAGQSHPGVSRLYLSRLIVRPAANTNDVTFAVTYQGPAQPPPGSSGVRWVVEDTTTLTSENETRDLDDIPLHTIYKAGLGAQAPSGITSPGSTGPKPAIHTAELPVLRPRRVLSVHGYIIGPPGEGVLDAVDCVNARPWQGKKRGYWLCTEASAQIEHNAPVPFDERVRQYRVGARFMSKIRRDWSQHLFHRNLHGRIPAELCTKEFGDKVKRAQQEPYSPHQDHSIANGYTRVGMYDVNDFARTFGF